MFVRDSCSKQLDSDRLAADVPEGGKEHERGEGGAGSTADARCNHAPARRAQTLWLGCASRVLSLARPSAALLHDGPLA
jgi:hypothetical protein